VAGTGGKEDPSRGRRGMPRSFGRGRPRPSCHPLQREAPAQDKFPGWDLIWLLPLPALGVLATCPIPALLDLRAEQTDLGRKAGLTRLRPARVVAATGPTGFPQGGSTAGGTKANSSGCRVRLLGADDLEVLVDEDVVRPVDADVMDFVLAAAQLHNTVDDAPRVGGQRSFRRLVRCRSADDRP
jgi:hypothetical protein